MNTNNSDDASRIIAGLKRFGTDRDSGGEFINHKKIKNIRTLLDSLIESNPDVAAQIINEYGDYPYLYNESISERYMVNERGAIVRTTSSSATSRPKRVTKQNAKNSDELIITTYDLEDMLQESLHFERHLMLL